MKYIDYFGELVETTIDDQPVLKFANKEIYISKRGVTSALHLSATDHYYLISLLTDYFGDTDEIKCQYYTFGAVTETTIFDTIPVPPPVFGIVTDSWFTSDGIRSVCPRICIEKIGDRIITDADEYTIRALAEDDIDLKPWYTENCNKDIEYKGFDSLWETPFTTASVVICDDINLPIRRLIETVG